MPGALQTPGFESRLLALNSNVAAHPYQCAPQNACSAALNNRGHSFGVTPPILSASTPTPEKELVVNPQPPTRSAGMGDAAAGPRACGAPSVPSRDGGLPLSQRRQRARAAGRPSAKMRPGFSAARV